MKIIRYKNLYLIVCLFIAANLLPISANARIGMELKNKNRLILKIDYKEAKNNDTLFLYVSNKFAGSLELGIPKSYRAIRTSEGLFYFDIALTANHGYFTLFGIRRSTVLKSGRNQMPLLLPQFWEKGDSVFVEITHKETGAGVYSKCKFSGRGAGKYTARHKITPQTEPEFDLPLEGTLNYGNYPLSSNIEIQQLKQYKHSMSNLSFEVLKADLHFSQFHGMFAALKKQYDTLLKNSGSETNKAFKSVFFSKFGKETFLDFDSKALANSSEYLWYCYEKSKFITYIEKPGFRSSDLFQTLVSSFKGEIRDILLIKHLQDSKRSGSIIEEFTLATSIVRDKECKKILDKMRTGLPGSKFNDYFLTDIAWKKIRLSDFDDKIVFIDFWFTGCGGCSLFYQNTLSKVEEHFKGDPSVVFLSISIDKIPRFWKESVIGGEYTAPSAINLFTNSLGVDHPITRENGIRDFPFAILLDRGRIIKEYNSENLYKYETLVSKIQSML